MIALNNSSQDMNPFTTIFKGNLNLEFPAYDFLDKMGPEVFKAFQSSITGEGSGSFYKVFTRFGASAPFRKDIYQLAKEQV
jgi:hypothetical protein